MSTEKSPLEELAEELLLSEERKETISKGKKRGEIEHSLTLHRSTTSAAEVKAMIQLLEDAGMPADAGLDVRVDHQYKTTRLYARWTATAQDVTK